MARKHHHLREDMKRHFHAFKAYHLRYYAGQIQDDTHWGNRIREEAASQLYKIWRTMNMREAWALSRIYVRALEAGYRQPAEGFEHELETRLYRSGLRYYGAKNPAWGRRMMWEKLNT